MTKKQKERAIRKHVKDMLKQSHDVMVKNIDKAIMCGVLDIDSWDPDDKPMIIPKIIVKALIESEALQYDARGTGYEKTIKKQVRKLRYFI